MKTETDNNPLVSRRRSAVSSNAESSLSLFQKLELKDFLIIFYIIVFVRQYLWVIGNNSFAWGFTLTVSALLWLAYVRFKQPIEQKTPRSFWLIVGIPLLAAYWLRAAFPDRSFDVLSYHIFHSERSLSGKLFIPGDFFPAYFPLLNPAPDMLTGISRRVLGYRLGTIINYLSLLWTGAILDRFIRHYIKPATLRCFVVLVVIFSEQLLFEINTYMIDLLALPLLLEAAYRALWPEEAASQARNFLFVSLLLGVSVAFKLTSLFFAIPIFSVCLYLMAGNKRRASLKLNWLVWLLGAVAFIIPLLPHTTYLYWQTGSPVFPFYNQIFRSPLSPPENWFDLRWGPKTLWETIVWPTLAVLKPERISEIPIYSGRMSLGFIAAIGGLLLARADRHLRALCFMSLASSILWSASSGYIRYGLLLELFGGLILLCLATHVLSSTYRLPFVLKWTPLVLSLCVLAGESIIATTDICRYGWGDQATVFETYRGSLGEARNLLRDRSFLNYLPATDKALFDGVEVWVESTGKTSAMMVLLKKDAPVISVSRYEFFITDAARKKFVSSLRQIQGKRMFTLCLPSEFDQVAARLRNHGFEIRKVVSLPVPYYSYAVKIDMLLIEVAPGALAL